jgi:hypothetical protein
VGSPPHEFVVVEWLELFDMAQNHFFAVANTTFFDELVHNLYFR